MSGTAVHKVCRPTHHHHHLIEDNMDWLSKLRVRIRRITSAWSRVLKKRKRKVRTMDLAMFTQIAEITGSLFLSSAAAVKGDKIRSLGITNIINITMDIPNLKLHNVESIQIHVDDVPTAHLGVYFDRCADKIHQVERMRGKTLVHCIAGVSRSASICIAYLMKYQHMSLDQAYKHCKRCRPVVHPNVGFWKQLIDYERRLYGRNTVKMIQSAIGWIPDVYKKEAESYRTMMPSTDRRLRYGYY